MKLTDRDYLLNKLEVSSREHGPIRCSAIPHEFDNNIFSVKATGPFGSLLFEEMKCDEYNIGHAHFRLKQDTTLQTTIDSPYLALHFVLKNNLHYDVEGLSPNVILKHQYNLMFVPALDSKHVLRKSHEYVVFSIHFSADYLDRWKEPFPLLIEFLDKVHDNAPALLSSSNIPATSAMLDIIQNILHCGYLGHLKKMFLQAKILELLMLALQQGVPERYAREVILRPSDIKRIQDAREYLVEHMENPCSLYELAQRFGINLFKLKKGFKQIYGTTVFALLTEERMYKAKKLLMETDMFINEVSELTGYKNVSNFTAAFKKKFGYPPSAIKQGLT